MIPAEGLVGIGLRAPEDGMFYYLIYGKRTKWLRTGVTTCKVRTSRSNDAFFEPGDGTMHFRVLESGRTDVREKELQLCSLLYCLKI